MRWEIHKIAVCESHFPPLVITTALVGKEARDSSGPERKKISFIRQRLQFPVAATTAT